MKKFITLILVLSMLMVGCGKSKEINGVKYKTVGIIEMVAKDNFANNDYSEDIRYELCVGNIIWTVFFIRYNHFSNLFFRIFTI